jgi:hypothetical protein
MAKLEQSRGTNNNYFEVPFELLFTKLSFEQQQDVNNGQTALL